MNDLLELAICAAIGLVSFVFGYLVGKTALAQKVSNWFMFHNDWREHDERED